MNRPPKADWFKVQSGSGQIPPAAHMSILDIFNTIAMIAVGCYLVWRGKSQKWREYDIKTARVHQETLGSWPIFNVVSKWNLWFANSPLRSKLYMIGGLIAFFCGIAYLFLAFKII